MTTILKIARFYALRRGPSAQAIALPYFRKLFVFPQGEMVWRMVIFVAVFTALAAVVSYVVSVNLILFAGEAMEQDKRVLASLERETAALAAALAVREAPSWVEERARANGMVEATGVRFLDSSDTVALFR